MVGRGTHRWAREYPPLALLAGAVLLAALALPSALILPQASPTQTLEYAPVPGASQAGAGSFSSLGLASSGSLGAGGAGGALAPPPGGGGNPTSKDCVGNPPRQTEDPLSPPCVPYFAGDNGGATYQGTTASEVRVLFYMEGGGTQSDGAQSQTAPVDHYYDAAQRNGPDPSFWITMLRNWMTYFNSRFQTYHRFVHFYVYFNRGTNFNAANDMVADAEANYREIKPFAAFGEFGIGDPNAYEETMAKHGVLGFGSLQPRSEGFFQQFPGLEWGFLPATDYLARSYSSFVCTKVAPNGVSFGNAADAGKKRVFGYLTTSDGNHPELQALGQQVAADLKSGCGITPKDTCVFPTSGYSVDPQTNPDYAVTCMAQFIRDGVTSLLWLDGYETNLSKAAGGAKYYPEWIIDGDQVSDSWISAFYQDQGEWAHAMVVSPEETTNSNSVPQSCEEAYTATSPNSPTLEMTFACQYFYADLMQLFTGIQVAGPRLTPNSLDEGFHAIPEHRSSSPQVPACFYLQADYTCVKDATAQWWDPTGWPGNGGCYRLFWSGDRYEPGQWPSGDPFSQESPSNPCTYFGGQKLS